MHIEKFATWVSVAGVFICALAGNWPAVMFAASCAIANARLAEYTAD